MNSARPAPPQPAALAKGALRRLAQAQLEPTPENYAKAYAEESGQPPPPPAAPPVPANDAKAQGAAWSSLVERLARNLERGGRQWTAARRKESLKRVLEGSRSDATRLLQRLQSLMGAWEADIPSDPAETGAEDPPVEAPPPVAGDAAAWSPLVVSLEGTVRAGLSAREPLAAGLAAELGALADAIAVDGATPQHVSDIESVCEEVRRFFGHRHRLLDELGDLCRELSAGMTEMAEQESWVRGQCESLQATLSEGLDQGWSVRGVRAASNLLAETRQRQHHLRGERQNAREALKQLIQNMLLEVGELGGHTGRFQLATAQHMAAIEGADTLESLADVVRAMLQDARAVQSAVSLSQSRLQADHARAVELEDKVRELEGELLRLSEEVSTDALTQVANRRGLTQAFEAESARSERAQANEPPAAVPRGLAVALIDIDNFKKLNDSLGHAAGDVALKTLAAAVRERLRPGDHLARFGGEEFVVLLPGSELGEAQQALTRLQRSLSEALFLHDGREVFVTFSAGVTLWRSGEALPATLERADSALYEAKRTGKNRTCIA